MIALHPCTPAGLARAQATVTAHHYLHQPVDSRCSPLAYEARLNDAPVGYLIFGRPESTCCYDLASKLTYGSLEDVQAGRCVYDRWELINLARVWLDPKIQRGGADYVPHAASALIKAALSRIGHDYLVAHPPVDCARPYQLRVCLSYCDTNIHTGYLYHVCRFKLARTNARGVQTFMKTLPELTATQDEQIRRYASQSERSRRYRAERAAQADQGVLW